MGMSNVLLSMEENKLDLNNNNNAVELNLLHQVNNNPTTHDHPMTTDSSNSLDEEFIPPDDELAVLKPTLGGLDAVEEGDDDEGFKTPSSPRSMIPPLKECPPAPGKPRGAPRIQKKKKKRKLVVVSRSRILLDYSDQVEAMFPLAIYKKELLRKDQQSSRGRGRK